MSNPPQGVQDVIARNVLKGDRWVVVNMSAVPPVVSKRGDLTHADWLAAMAAIQSFAEK